LALFGKKKSTPEAPEEANGAPVENGASGSDPAKARRFFEHARTMHEASNYEYAVTLWLQGLRQDPTSMEGLEHFYESAQAFARSSKKPGPSKDQAKAFGRKGPVERYLTGLLEWGTRQGDVGAGVKAVEAGAKADLDEPTYWVGERVLRAASAGDRPKKEHFVKLKDLFKEMQAFDLAVRAGQEALTLDPTDGPLDAEVRNLSAQAAMSKGGYETTGEEGGFRRNIRDLESQRRFEEESAIAKSEDAATRVVNAAKADYESRPTDPASIMKFAKALQERGQGDDEKIAISVLLKGYEQTKEFRFREQAGVLNLRRARRKIRSLKEKAEQNPEDEAARQQLEEGQRKLLEAEIKELRLQVEAYPTDRMRKFELGKRLFLVGQFEDAIALFQESQNDAKARVPSLNYLGQAFLRLGWTTEAIETLRHAIEAHPSEKDETGMELRYSLMLALAQKAREDQDAARAEEAVRIASSLAMLNISYRDIRKRREELQSLQAELKA